MPNFVLLSYNIYLYLVFTCNIKYYLTKFKKIGFKHIMYTLS